MAFFPLVFTINFFIHPKYSNIFLLLASLVFYSWGEPYFVFLMIISIVINWLLGLSIDRIRSHSKFMLVIAIASNLAILGYFKYVGFGIEIINNVLKRELLPIPDIRLPIGISFFTFQSISYLVEVYRKESKAQTNIINTALYISFFPQLIAGPIVKYKDINMQIENRTITGGGIAYGFRQFIYGLSKKVLISNILGKSVDIIFSMNVSMLDGKTVWIASIFYTFQIYYDFSGYSDMAIGLGKMFGFNIPENFNYPYLSLSICDFWRRWHISLGSWFKEYVYIPLGGNRKGNFRTYSNLAITFFLTGLWHGAGINFIIWGFYHGFFSLMERLCLKRILEKYKIISHIYLLFIVNFGWVLFRSETLSKALLLVMRMIMPWKYNEYNISIWEYANFYTLFTSACAIIGMGFLQKIIPSKYINWWKLSVPEFIYCACLLIISIATIASNTYNPFIYFQF